MTKTDSFVAEMVCPFQGQDIHQVELEVLKCWHTQQWAKHTRRGSKPMSHQKALLDAVLRHLAAEGVL